MKFKPSTTLVVPTLNAAAAADSFLRALEKQTLHPGSLLIIDSQSEDTTRDLFFGYGADVITIDSKEFDHGSTRQIAVEKCSQTSDIVIFMTQDAILADSCSLEKLVEAFADERVGAAYGRQLPRHGASPIEAHARLYNYPPVSQVKTLEDKALLGIKTCFLSNSFAAYRSHMLKDVDGFPCKNIVSEETFVAAKMQESGWKIKYCADAKVYHSHNYSIVQDFQRCFDVGVFHSQRPWIREVYGHAEGEGKKFVFSEVVYLWERSILLIPSALLRTAVKYIGFRLGLLEARLPNMLKMYLSMQKHFWSK